MAPRPLRGALRIVLLAAAFAAATGRAAPAQNPKDPADVARLFFDAFHAQRWDDALTILRLTELVSYPDSLAGWHRRAPPPRQLTVEKLMRMDPDLPRAMAEYQVSQHRKNAGKYKDYVLREFADFTSYEELASLPPMELGRRWQRAQHVTHRFTQYARAANCPTPLVADSLPASPAPEVLGGVVTQDSIAYAIVSEFPEAHRASNYHAMVGTRVEQLRRDRREWRLIPDVGLLGPLNQASSFVCEFEADSARSR